MRISLPLTSVPFSCLRSPHSSPHQFFTPDLDAHSLERYRRTPVSFAVMALREIENPGVEDRYSLCLSSTSTLTGRALLDILKSKASLSQIFPVLHAFFLSVTTSSVVLTGSNRFELSAMRAISACALRPEANGGFITVLMYTNLLSAWKYFFRIVITQQAYFDLPKNESNLILSAQPVLLSFVSLTRTSFRCSATEKLAEQHLMAGKSHLFNMVCEHMSYASMLVLTSSPPPCDACGVCGRGRSTATPR